MSRNVIPSPYGRWSSRRMLIVMGTVALPVFEKLGLAMLRSAWINLDYIREGTLIAAGIVSFFV